jgi:hypothetical protein
MTDMNPDEARADYVNKLGDEFGNSYYHAHAEWCDLWLTWKQFKNLFCRGAERVDLINRSGAGFFERVERFFLDSVFLAICRLSDPVKTMGKENLTVKVFLQFMDTDARRKELAALLGAVEKITEFARDWRNRAIGHNDLNLKLGAAEPLKEALLSDIENAIDALFQVFKYIHTEVLESDVLNEVIDGLNNEMVMLDRLYLGDQVFQNNMEALGPGHYTALEFPQWLMNS